MNDINEDFGNLMKTTFHAKLRQLNERVSKLRLNISNRKYFWWITSSSSVSNFFFFCVEILQFQSRQFPFFKPVIEKISKNSMANDAFVFFHEWNGVWKSWSKYKVIVFCWRKHFACKKIGYKNQNFIRSPWNKQRETRQSFKIRLHADIYGRRKKKCVFSWVNKQ